MIKVESSDINRLARYLATLSKQPEKILRRVSTSAGRATQTFAGRAIVKVYTAKVRRVQQGLRTIAAKEGIGFILRGYRSPIGLHNFAYNASRARGVAVQVKRGGGKKHIRGAFAAPARNFAGSLSPGEPIVTDVSTVRIFTRSTYKRLPINALFGPSVADMLVNSVTNEAIFKFGTDKITSELQRQIEVAIRG